MTDQWHSGNAGEDGIEHRGWLLGHFIDPDKDGLRSTPALEVKWGIHPEGDRRAEWTTGEQRTTLLLLVEGRFRLDLRSGGHDDTVTLSRRGDYVLWGPGTDHSWQAELDSVVITVRWPSLT